MGNPEKPIVIRVAIVTMFDPPKESGWPSELTRWVEGVPLRERLAFPAGERDLYLNRDKGVLALVTGVGNSKAAARVTALGLDPRFDFSRSYWLVAGIAGANPATLPLGGACWADWVVDGDLAHDIDPREMPPDWPTGRVPLGKSAPYQQPASTLTATMAWRLNPALVDWAYRETQTLDVPVRIGAVLASNSLWHGALLNRWAEDWVKYWTDGRGRFLASAMEDSGIALALDLLARAGRVDSGRFLVLRTASNFNTPPASITAAASLAGEMRQGFTAYVPALDAAYRVGAVIADKIVTDWDRYATEPPR